jgi:hydrogenase nickel incorporation protein HypA/HybF
MFFTDDALKKSRRASRAIAVHELSIANRIVEIASERCREEGARAKAVTLRIGALSCVHEDALRFSFDLVREGTPLADATLRIVSVPVTIWCGPCGREVALPGIQKFACPACGTPSGDIRGGRELDLESIELGDDAGAGAVPRPPSRVPLPPAP